MNNQSKLETAIEQLKNLTKEEQGSAVHIAKQYKGGEENENRIHKKTDEMSYG